MPLTPPGQMGCRGASFTLILLLRRSALTRPPDAAALSTGATPSTARCFTTSLRPSCTLADSAPARALIGAYLRADVFRWAVQADYFARRICENNLTGISGPQENENGLEDGRRFLVHDD
jgi:hypothetical protein